ncbi:hypothetical protein [Chryseobacterium sp.]|uniref:hypothetical protein n=1 Tax=Chryseobacterium sp. TaxID=1871047 RepID=UPI0028A28FBF|nr:hypothetical protein [Chryseobacterium sp.]
MKYIYIAILLFSVFAQSFAQVVIGDNAGSTLPNEKALLSFTSENMGIVLPILSTAALESSVGSQDGSLYVSRANKTVKFYTEPNENNTTGLVALTSVAPSAYTMPTLNNTTEITTTGVIIGANTTAVQGVLVLEDSEKTLVLPKLGDVANPPHLSVTNPYIGTIGFSEIENVVFPATKPAKKFFWVYGGGGTGVGEWHLWSAGVERPPVNPNPVDINNFP